MINATTVFVARWTETPQRCVLSAIRQRVEAGGHAMGAVLAPVAIAHPLTYGTTEPGGWVQDVRTYDART